MPFEGPIRNSVVVVASDDLRGGQLRGMCLEVPEFCGEISQVSSVAEAVKLHAETAQGCYLVEGERQGVELCSALSDAAIIVIVIVSEPLFDHGLQAMTRGIQDCLLSSEVTAQSIRHAVLKSRARIQGHPGMLGVGSSSRELRDQLKSEIHDIRQQLQAANFAVHTLKQTLPPDDVQRAGLINDVVRDLARLAQRVTHMMNRL